MYKSDGNDLLCQARGRDRLPWMFAPLNVHAGKTGSPNGWDLPQDGSSLGLRA
jgi:hypothetical protein